MSSAGLRRRRAAPGLATPGLAAAAASLIALVALTACGGSGAAGSPGPAASGSVTGPVTVFAAASLTESFRTLAGRFEAAHPGVRVTLNFGASSALAQQIVAGAPADAFAAASTATMTQADASHDLAGPPRVFVRNRLEIAVAKGNPARLAGLADLARPGLKVALCAPQVPCGAAAVKALATGGVTVHPVTLEQDVKATLAKVELGEVDAALVYRTDVAAARGAVAGIDFPESAAASNSYPIAVLAHAPHRAVADAFVTYVLSPQGRAVLTDAGFAAP